MKGAQIAGVDRLQLGDDPQLRHGVLDFLIHRARNRARPFFVLAIDERLLLFPGFKDELAGETGHGHRDREHDESEDRSKPDSRR